MSSSCVVIGFIRGDLLGCAVSKFVVLGFSVAVACDWLLFSVVIGGLLFRVVRWCCHGVFLTTLRDVGLLESVGMLLSRSLVVSLVFWLSIPWYVSLINCIAL